VPLTLFALDALIVLDALIALELFALHAQFNCSTSKRACYKRNFLPPVSVNTEFWKYFSFFCGKTAISCTFIARARRSATFLRFSALKPQFCDTFGFYNALQQEWESHSKAKSRRKSERAATWQQDNKTTWQRES
jgi:hypothetical protein